MRKFTTIKNGGAEAHDGLTAYAPDFLGSLWTRFSDEGTINYFYMLGRSAEGIGNWEKAKDYYADAHFALTPHSDARAGLKRVYQQIERRNPTTTFEEFLKDTESEYKIREEADREHIRQKLLSNRINEKAADFRLETMKQCGKSENKKIAQRTSERKLEGAYSEAYKNWFTNCGSWGVHEYACRLNHEIEIDIRKKYSHD